MKNNESIFWGIALIIIGVVFLGNNLELWNLNIFFDGWWTLFIIVPSIRGLFSKDSFAWSFVTLAFGVLMLLANQNVIAWGMVWKLFVPVIIIVVGLYLILVNRKRIKIDSKNAKKYVAVFSGIEEKIKEIVCDFRMVAVFGGIELDLRKAKIDKEIIINAVTVFGGIDLKLPDNVNLVINGLPIFGGVDNKYDNDGNQNVTIQINYVCIFGGIDLL